MNVAFAAKTAAGVALAGGGAYGIQQWQSGELREEQARAEGRAAEAMRADRPLEAKSILDDAPSNRERDWDKMGVLGGAGALAAAGGFVFGPFSDYMSPNGQTTHGGRVGAAVALVGLAAVAGAAAGVVTNTTGRFD